jgi:hypothetical protein
VPGVRGVYVFIWKPVCFLVGAREPVNVDASCVVVAAGTGAFGAAVAYVRLKEYMSERH